MLHWELAQHGQKAAPGDRTPLLQGLFLPGSSGLGWPCSRGTEQTNSSPGNTQTSHVGAGTKDLSPHRRPPRSAPADAGPRCKARNRTRALYCGAQLTLLFQRPPQGDLSQDTTSAAPLQSLELRTAQPERACPTTGGMDQLCPGADTSPSIGWQPKCTEDSTFHFPRAPKAGVAAVGPTQRAASTRWYVAQALASAAHLLKLEL